MSLRWSTPYFGVQHLSGHPKLDQRPRVYQVTLEAYPTGAEWCVLALQGGTPFTPIKEGTCADVEAAKRAAEKAFSVLV